LVDAVGNEQIHRLTSGGRVFRLRVDMWDVEGHYWTAEYPAFRVASADQLYRLDLSHSPADGDLQRTRLPHLLPVSD